METTRKARRGIGEALAEAASAAAGFLPAAVVAALLGAGILAASAMGGKWLALAMLSYLALAVGVVFPDKRLFAVLVLAGCAPIGFLYKLLTHGSKFGLLNHYGGALAEPVVNLVDIPIMLLLALWVIDIATGARRPPRWIPLDTWMAAFLLWSSLSLYNTDHHALLFFELLRYAKYFVLYFVLRTYLVRPAYFWGAIAVSISVLLLQGMVSAMQYFLFFRLPIPVGGVTDADFELVNNIVIQRVTGVLGHSNTFSAYLSMICSMGVVVLFARVRWVFKIAAVPFLMLGCLSLVLTFSRNGWMIFVLDALLVMGYALHTRRLKVAYVAVAVLAALLFVGALVASGVFEIILVRVFDDDGKAFDSRFDLLRVAFEMIRAHPFLGIGLNSFEENMIFYDFTRITNVIQQPVHNAYMLVAAETGLPALAMMLVPLGALIKRAHRLALRDDELSFAVGAIGLCVFLGGGVSNLFDLTIRKEPIIGVVVLVGSMVVALHQKHEEESQNASRDPASSR